MTTVDYNDDTERLVRQGWISAAMAQTPVTMGRWGVRVAMLALAKQPIPEKLFTPTYVITKENADKIDERLEAATVVMHDDTRNVRPVAQEIYSTARRCGGVGAQ